MDVTVPLQFRDAGAPATVGNEVFLRVADVTYRVASADAGLRIRVQGDLERFRVQESQADVNVEARWADLATMDLARMRQTFDSGALWRSYEQNGTYLFAITSPALGRLPYKVARVDKSFDNVEVLLHRPYFARGEAVYPLEYPLDELLMTRYLAQGHGIEFHASGVVDASNRGWIFAGQSGAGKTTMARLWQKRAGCTILSDDRIVVRKREGRFWMYGTPWHGEARLSCRERAPLSGVYLLRQGSENRVEPQPTAAAVARLFACSFPVFHSPDSLDFTLVFLEEIATTIPCCELAFAPDERVVELIEGNRSGIDGL